MKKILKLLLPILLAASVNAQIPFSFINNRALPNGSFKFDTVAKYFKSSAASLLNNEIKGTTQKFSISVWFKRRIVDGTYQTVFSRDGNVGAGQRQIACEFDDVERWTFFIADNKTNYTWWKTVSTFTDTSIFYNLIDTFDNTQTGDAKHVVYVNGDIQATTTTTLGAGVSNVNDQPTEPIYIGVTNFDNAGLAVVLENPIKGYFNNIDFYTGILTPSDAALIYYSGNQARSVTLATSIAPYMSWYAPSSTLSPPTVNDNVGTSYGVSKVFASYSMSVSDYVTVYPTVPSYQTETTTLAAAMSTPPTAARKGVIDLFIKGCKTDANWSLIDAMWFEAAETQQAGRLNWVAPASYTLTEVSSPAWVADQGYTGDGTASYLNTGFNPSTNGVNYTFGGGLLGFYERLNINEGKAQIGNANSGTSITIITARNGGNFLAKMHCNINLSQANTNSQGLYLVYRTSSTAQFLSKNGAAGSGGSGTAVSIPNNNIYVLCYNNNGAAALFCTNQISFSIIGGGGINKSKLYTRVQNYMKALGTQVN